MNRESFDRFILAGRIVLVDFWGEWCGYCKVMDPIVESVAEKYRDKIVVGRVNADENREIAARFGVEGLPVFMLFFKGRPACSFLGAAPRRRFESWVEECLERNTDFERG